ncbi:hypothetical protein OG698_22945 [Streptomyces sp. NBC_01003]|nr:hypothetical protein OG698_22945 [Streptomyces sp. NBC_01003]
MASTVRTESAGPPSAKAASICAGWAGNCSPVPGSRCAGICANDSLGRPTTLTWSRRFETWISISESVQPQATPPTWNFFCSWLEMVSRPSVPMSRIFVPGPSAGRFTAPLNASTR